MASDVFIYVANYSRGVIHIFEGGGGRGQKFDVGSFSHLMELMVYLFHLLQSL